MKFIETDRKTLIRMMRVIDFYSKAWEVDTQEHVSTQLCKYNSRTDRHLRRKVCWDIKNVNDYKERKY